MVDRDKVVHLCGHGYAFGVHWAWHTLIYSMDTHNVPAEALKMKMKMKMMTTTTTTMNWLKKPVEEEVQEEL
jgi:hypothetical protein